MRHLAQPHCPGQPGAALERVQRAHAGIGGCTVIAAPQPVVQARLQLRQQFCRLLVEDREQLWVDRVDRVDVFVVVEGIGRGMRRRDGLRRRVRERRVDGRLKQRRCLDGRPGSRARRLGRRGGDRLDRRIDRRRGRSVGGGVARGRGPGHRGRFHRDVDDAGLGCLAERGAVVRVAFGHRGDVETDPEIDVDGWRGRCDACVEAWPLGVGSRIRVGREVGARLGRRLRGRQALVLGEAVEQRGRRGAQEPGRELVQQPADLVGHVGEQDRLAGSARAGAPRAHQRVLQRARQSRQVRIPDGRRTAGERVRERDRGLGHRPHVGLHAPLADLRDQPAREFIGLVEVDVEQRDADAKRADDLDLLVVGRRRLDRGRFARRCLRRRGDRCRRNRQVAEVEVPGRRPCAGLGLLGPGRRRRDGLESAQVRPFHRLGDLGQGRDGVAGRLGCGVEDRRRQFRHRQVDRRGQRRPGRRRRRRRSLGVVERAEVEFEVEAGLRRAGGRDPGSGLCRRRGDRGQRPEIGRVGRIGSGRDEVQVRRTGQVGDARGQCGRQVAGIGRLAPGLAAAEIEIERRLFGHGRQRRGRLEPEFGGHLAQILQVGQLRQLGGRQRRRAGPGLLRFDQGVDRLRGGERDHGRRLRLDRWRDGGERSRGAGGLDRPSCAAVAQRVCGARDIGEAVAVVAPGGDRLGPAGEVVEGLGREPGKRLVETRRTREARVVQLLASPGGLAEVAQPDHARAALERVEGAPHRRQRGDVVGLLRERGERLARTGDDLARLVDEDLAHLVVVLEAGVCGVRRRGGGGRRGDHRRQRCHRQRLGRDLVEGRECGLAPGLTHHCAQAPAGRIEAEQRLRQVRLHREHVDEEAERPQVVGEPVEGALAHGLLRVDLGLRERIDVVAHVQHGLRRGVEAEHREHAAHRVQLPGHRDQQLALRRVAEVRVDLLLDLGQRGTQFVHHAAHRLPVADAPVQLLHPRLERLGRRPEADVVDAARQSSHAVGQVGRVELAVLDRRVEVEHAGGDFHRQRGRRCLAPGRRLRDRGVQRLRERLALREQPARRVLDQHEGLDQAAEPVQFAAGDVRPDVLGRRDALACLRDHGRVETAEPRGLVVDRVRAVERPRRAHAGQPRQRPRAGVGRAGLGAEEEQVARELRRGFGAAAPHRLAQHREQPRGDALGVHVGRQQPGALGLEEGRGEPPQRGRVARRAGPERRAQVAQRPRRDGVVRAHQCQHQGFHLAARSFVGGTRRESGLWRQRAPFEVAVPQIGRVDAIGPGELLGLAVLRKHRHRRHGLAGETARDEVQHRERRALDDLHRAGVDHRRPRRHALHRGLGRAQHARRSCEPHQLERAGTLVQLDARRAQHGRVDRVDVAASGRLRLLQVAPQRLQRRLEGLAQFGAHPSERAQVVVGARGLGLGVHHLRRSSGVGRRSLRRP